MSPFLDIIFISQVVALFLKTKDFKTFSHIFQPLHNVFLKHMQNTMTEGNQSAKRGENSSSIEKFVNKYCDLLFNSWLHLAFGDFLKCKSVQYIKIYLCIKQTSLVEMWLAYLTESKMKRQHILEIDNIWRNIYKCAKYFVDSPEFSCLQFFKMRNTQNKYSDNFFFLMIQHRPYL